MPSRARQPFTAMLEQKDAGKVLPFGAMGGA
jgi:hypothetical protein